MIASTAGLVGYLLIRWICEKSPDCYLFVCAFVAVIVGGLLLISATTTGRFLFVAVTLTVWTGATFLERGAYPSQESWLETLFKFAVATICSALLDLVFLASIDGSIPHRSMSPDDEVWFFNGYLTGAIISPVSIPISLWGWKTARLRPGIDRHLKEGERKDE